jgi:hypothetical protein
MTFEQTGKLDERLTKIEKEMADIKWQLENQPKEKFISEDSMNGKHLLPNEKSIKNPYSGQEKVLNQSEQSRLPCKSFFDHIWALFNDVEAEKASKGYVDKKVRFTLIISILINILIMLLIRK